LIRQLGFGFGAAFVFGGLLSFVPGVVRDELYLGVFSVNPPHNMMHIASGAVFLIASAVGASPARLWFQLFGAFYGVLALVGLQVGRGMICGVIANNPYDSWGHAALAAAMLAIGLGLPRRRDSLRDGPSSAAVRK
jgi:hypothetical protein